MKPDKAQLVESTALKLCAHRKEDPGGRIAVLKGNTVETGTFLDQAREDVKVVLEAAIPGFLDDKVEVLSTDPSIEDPIPF